MATTASEAATIPTTAATSRSSAGWAALFALAWLTGCAVRVRLVSKPVGAVVTRIDPLSNAEIERCVTPCTWRFKVGPGQHAPLHITANGYFPLDVDMNRTEGPLLRLIGGAIFQRGGREVTFLLVPQHEPIGTITPAAESN